MKLSKIFKIALPIVFSAAAIAGVSYGVYYFVSKEKGDVGHHSGSIVNSVSVAATLSEANQLFGENNVKVNGDNVTISGYTKPDNVSKIVLPSSVDGKEVVYTQQFKDEFRNAMGMNKAPSPSDARNEVKSIKLPTLSDGDYGFLSRNANNGDGRIIFPNLESVVLDDSIKSLPNDFFVSCSKLTTINIPTSMTEIPVGFLKLTAIKEITIPSNIKKIGCAAFQGVKTLITINFDSLIKDIFIDSLAFQNCDNLSLINFNNVESIIDEKSFEIPKYAEFWWIFKDISKPKGQIDVYLNKTLHDEFEWLFKNNPTYTHNFLNFIVK